VLLVSDMQIGRFELNRMLSLQAEADPLGKQRQDGYRVRFGPHIEEEISAIKEKWAATDAQATVASLHTAIEDLSSTAALSVAAASTRNAQVNDERAMQTKE
jgi:hypothetical protein